jgi:hypothetical protein
LKSTLEQPASAAKPSMAASSVRRDLHAWLGSGRILGHIRGRIVPFPLVRRLPKSRRNAPFKFRRECLTN